MHITSPLHHFRPDPDMITNNHLYNIFSGEVYPDRLGSLHKYAHHNMIDKKLRPIELYMRYETITVHAMLSTGILAIYLDTHRHDVSRIELHNIKLSLTNYLDWLAVEQEERRESKRLDALDQQQAMKEEKERHADYSDQ